MSTGGVEPSSRRLGFRELHRPARVAILLAEFGGLVLPFVWNAAFLDRLLLLLRVALARRGDQAGVDDLAGHGDVAGLRAAIASKRANRL